MSDRARKGQQLTLAAERGRAVLSMLKGERYVPAPAPVETIERAEMNALDCMDAPDSHEARELATLATLAHATADACEAAGACVALVLHAHDGLDVSDSGKGPITEGEVTDAWRGASSACGMAIALARGCELLYPLPRGKTDARHVAASNTRIAATLLRWHVRELVLALAQARGWSALARLSQASSHAT